MGIDRRVCGWRAKHAGSLGHWISFLVAQIRAGQKSQASVRLAFMLNRYYEENNIC